MDRKNGNQSADCDTAIKPDKVEKCASGCFELDYADDGDCLVCRQCGNREPYKRKKVNPDYVPSDLW